MSAELPRRLGPYVLLAPLAHSDAATTYLARSTAEARLTTEPLVVKLHHPPLDAAALARAHRRMTVISRHVPRTLEVGLADEGSYVVLEHVAGWSVAAVLEAEPARWPVRSAARLLYGVAQALAKLGALADTDRVHGHLSPDTVLLGVDGRARLIGLDRPGGAGALGYAAPEQLMQAPLDPRVDLYALGALAWRLLSGRPWIAPGPPAAMRRATLEAEPTSLTTWAPEVPRRLDALVQALLAPEPTSRFDSAESVAEALVALVPEADTPEPDVSERVGEALWSTRESTRTLVARASESMVEFHRPGEAFEGWSPAATPAAVVLLEPTAESASRHTPIGARRSVDGARPSATPRTSDPQLARRSSPSLPPPTPPAVRWVPAVAAATLGGTVLATLVVALSSPPSDVVVVPLPSAALDGGATAVWAVASSSLAARVVASTTAAAVALDPAPSATPTPSATSLPLAGATPTPSSARGPNVERPRPVSPRPSPSAGGPTSPRPDLVVAEISRLLARARLARSRSVEPDRRTELDKIIGALVLEASATEAPGLAERLRAHDVRLTAIEQAPR